MIPLKYENTESREAKTKSTDSETFLVFYNAGYGNPNFDECDLNPILDMFKYKTFNLKKFILDNVHVYHNKNINPANNNGCSTIFINIEDTFQSVMTLRDLGLITMVSICADIFSRKASPTRIAIDCHMYYRAMKTPYHSNDISKVQESILHNFSDFLKGNDFPIDFISITPEDCKNFFMPKCDKPVEKCCINSKPVQDPPKGDSKKCDCKKEVTLKTPVTKPPMDRKLHIIKNNDCVTISGKFETLEKAAEALMSGYKKISKELSKELSVESDTFMFTGVYEMFEEIFGKPFGDDV